MIMHRKLNTDDLIIFYLVLKIKSGRDYEIGKQELLNFLEYFNSQKNLYDFKLDYDEIVNHLHLKKKKKWGNSAHIVLNNQNNLEATYELNSLDIKESEIYCLSDKEIEEIKFIILNYLKQIPLKQINMNINSNISNISYECSALMCQTIWNNYIDTYGKMCKWPIQCQSMEQYLLNYDLAPIISLPSIKDDMLKFYKEFARRLECLINSNNKLILSSNINHFLASANYKYCIDGFKNLLEYIDNKEINIEIKNKKDGQKNIKSVVNNCVSEEQIKKMVKIFHMYS